MVSVPKSVLDALTRAVELLANKPEANEDVREDRDWLSTARAAKRIDMAPGFIRKLRESGEVTFANFSETKKVISRRSLDKWIALRTVKAARELSQ